MFFCNILIHWALAFNSCFWFAWCIFHLKLLFDLSDAYSTKSPAWPTMTLVLYWSDIAFSSPVYGTHVLEIWRSKKSNTFVRVSSLETKALHKPIQRLLYFFGCLKTNKYNNYLDVLCNIISIKTYSIFVTDEG